ncbi:MAG: CRISPR-associated endonuclease Cas2 [Nitrososphaeria archaeon]
MRLLVIYDISDNAMRLRIMNRLFSKGLRRINLSGYIGSFNRNDFEPLLLSLKQYVAGERDSLYAIPIEESEVKRIRIIERAGIRGVDDETISVA